MLGRSFRFSHALCRKPARSVTLGLRAQDQGDPDPTHFETEHAAYVAALQDAGVTVTVLEAQEDFPDSVFIEDAALCLAGTAIALRPGAASRFGETAALRPTLEKMFSDVIDLPPEGYVDGGDILCSDNEVMIGLSARTDQNGAKALGPIVERLGYRLRILNTTQEILHFKTESSLLDSETILATERLAATGCFEGYRVILTPKGEDAAANAIRVNDKVLVSKGFPETEALLTAEGYDVTALPTSQAALVDGGLSCMSLRFTL